MYVAKCTFEMFWVATVQKESRWHVVKECLRVRGELSLRGECFSPHKWARPLETNARAIA